MEITVEDEGGYYHGKKRRIPRRRNAGKYGKSDETGTEDAASDGRTGKGNGDKEFSATAGGGAVEVTVSGSKKILKVKLDEEVVDPDDVEMLEDLLVAAVNEALEKVDAETTSAMSKFTGGMGGGMPGYSKRTSGKTDSYRELKNYGLLQ